MGTNDVQVWLGSVDVQHAAVLEMEACLSADEHARAGQFVFDRDRKRYVVCRALLRRVVAACLESDPARLNMSVNRYGKPVLKNATIDFNLSHSGTMATIAVARRRRVGIDIERIDNGRPVMRLAERFFSRPEAEKIRALSGQARQRAFYTCWTRKEACVKALGKGLAIPSLPRDLCRTLRAFSHFTS